MRVLALAMLVLLVTSIVSLPISRAWAAQTLEIPSQANSTSVDAAPMPSPAPDPRKPAPYTDNTPIAGMGGIGDYMNQPGERASAGSGYPSQAAGNYAYNNNPSDPRANSSQLLTAALVGGAIIGLIALSNYSAHHQRHR